MAQQQTVISHRSDTDLDVYEHVLEAIEDDHVVRETRVPVFVSVEDGVVTVNGNVLSETMRERVLLAAAATPGVKKVVDNLYSDPEIERAIADRLVGESALKGNTIEVSSYQGVVTLVGGVSDERQRQMAVSLAAATPGVRQVIDRLTMNAT